MNAATGTSPRSARMRVPSIMTRVLLVAMKSGTSKVSRSSSSRSRYSVIHGYLSGGYVTPDPHASATGQLGSTWIDTTS